MKSKILIIVTGLFMMTVTSFGTTAVFSRPVAEKEIPMESWMVTPFNDSFSEEAFIEKPMCLEPWMVTPFEEAFIEKPMRLEPWMTTPFEKAHDEEPQCLEPWMTKQFERAMCCAGEEWIIAAREK
jgi:hypothetical protein